LGTEICRQLKQDRLNEVWAIDNHSRSSTVPPCDKFLNLDLMRGDAFADLPTDFDYIYHYSAINGTKNFYERPNHLLWNNMMGDFNMFKFASANADLKKFVYASTSEIVSGDPQSPVPEQIDVTIRDIHNPRWSYRIPKIASENFLVNSKLPWAIIRYFNVYGSQSKPGHFVADQIRKIRSGVFEIIGSNETRSFCHVQDAVRATVFCAETTQGQVINVGNDRETQIGDAVRIMAQALGVNNADWNEKPGLAGSTPNRRPDISRLRSLMQDYDPMPFEQGIQEVIANGDWQ
jgi:nucleoside-diphosphate-sugar epimerase